MFSSENSVYAIAVDELITKNKIRISVKIDTSFITDT